MTSGPMPPSPVEGQMIQIGAVGLGEEGVFRVQYGEMTSTGTKESESIGQEAGTSGRWRRRSEVFRATAEGLTRSPPALPGEVCGVQ